MRSASCRSLGYRPGGRVHFRPDETLDSAAAGGGGRCVSLSGFGKVMLFTADYQRCGWATGRHG